MKKKILKITASVFLILFGVWCYLAFIGIENKLPISEGELMGKTKIEVLELEFERSPRVFNEKKINVAIFTKNGALHNFYFLNLGEALSKKEFMESSNWCICLKQDPFRINGVTNYLRIDFEDGKVVNVKKSGYSEF